jgi:hypothetical protein
MNQGNCSEIYFRFKKIYEVIMKQILRKSSAYLCVVPSQRKRWVPLPWKARRKHSLWLSHQSPDQKLEIDWCQTRAVHLNRMQVMQGSDRDELRHELTMSIMSMDRDNELHKCSEMTNDGKSSRDRCVMSTWLLGLFSSSYTRSCSTRDVVL